MLTADEVPSGNISAFIERDLIEDAWDCEDEMMAPVSARFCENLGMEISTTFTAWM